MKKKFSKENRGFTLVETLVSIAIFSISILGILSVLATGVTNTTYAKNKMIAGYLAQEGIEYLRNLRDNDALFPATNGGWSAFVTTMTITNTCTQASPCGFNSSSIPISIFKCTADPLTCKLYFNNNTYNDVAGGIYSGFIRKVWIVQPAGVNGSDELEVNSEVDWKQGSTNVSIILSDNLFNWE